MGLYNIMERVYNQDIQVMIIYDYNVIAVRVRRKRLFLVKQTMILDILL